MNHGKRYVSIRLDGEPMSFDEEIMENIKDVFIKTSEYLKKKNGKCTIRALANELQMDRNRPIRIAKALGITEIFE